MKPQLMEKMKQYVGAGWWIPKAVPQAALLLCIPKKSGKLRMVVDCRQRNDNTIKDVTPFPAQDQIQMDVAQAKFHSKIDLSNTYEQVRIEPEDVHKTAFVTVYRMCKSNVLQQGVSRAVLAPPSLSYKPVTPASRDHGNISHDPTHDSSRDPFATCTSRDLSARDPGNLRPRDPGKITHDLSRNWSSTKSPDQMRFGHASNPLINTWQIMGTINKMRPLNNQRTRNTTQSTNTRRNSINEDATH